MTYFFFKVRLRLAHDNSRSSEDSTEAFCHSKMIDSWLTRECCRLLTLTVLVATIDAQWEGMGDVGSARYEPALLPPCPTIRVLSYSN